MKSTGDTKGASLLANAFSASGVVKSHTAPPLESVISRESAGDLTIDVGVIARFLRNCDRGRRLDLAIAHRRRFALRNAAVGHCDFLEQMRRSDRARGIMAQE